MNTTPRPAARPAPSPRPFPRTRPRPAPINPDLAAGLAGGILLLAAIVWIIARIGASSPPMPPAASAYYAAEDAVRARLAIPKSATFSGRHTPGDGAYLHTNSLYLARGSVEARNPFGVMIPHRWEAALWLIATDEHGQCRWSAIAVAIGNDELSHYYTSTLPTLKDLAAAPDNPDAERARMRDAANRQAAAAPRP